MKSSKPHGAVRRRIQDTLDRAADGVLLLLSLLLVGIVLLAVFFRYVLGHALYWSDEVVRYLFVWFTLLGAAICVRQREHIRVEYFAEKLPPRVQRVLQCGLLWVVCGFQVVMVWIGFAWVWSVRGSLTSAFQWPLNWCFYAALPVGMLLAAAYSLRRLRRAEFTESGSAPEQTDDPGRGETRWNC